jgi:hypothetical protein
MIVATAMKTGVPALPTADATEPTEPFRRLRLAELSPGVARDELERRHGQTWDPKELAAAFRVIGFMAPFVVVRRRADGRLGSLEFQHDPRFYFHWREDA